MHKIVFICTLFVQIIIIVPARVSLLVKNSGLTTSAERSPTFIRAFPGYLPIRPVFGLSNGLCNVVKPEFLTTSTPVNRPPSFKPDPTSHHRVRCQEATRVRWGRAPSRQSRRPNPVPLCRHMRAPESIGEYRPYPLPVRAKRTELRRSCA